MELLKKVRKQSYLTRSFPYKRGTIHRCARQCPAVPGLARPCPAVPGLASQADPIPSLLLTRRYSGRQSLGKAQTPSNYYYDYYYYYYYYYYYSHYLGGQFLICQGCSPAPEACTTKNLNAGNLST